jgi:hypothetical protein
MNSTRWNIFVLALVILLAAAVSFSSYEIDIFGIFHDPTGKQLRVHQNERTAKYLLSQRYVPANFNALMLGYSSSSSWDLSRVKVAKIYNESINGATITEEQMLANQALTKGHYRFVLCLLQPKTTSDHGLNEASGTPTHREALGSINVFREEFNAFRQKHGQPSIHYSNGDEELVAPHRHETIIPEEWRHFDPVAMSQFHELLDTLHRDGIQVIFFRPPIAGYFYHVDEKFFDEYTARTGLIKPGDLYINFMQPKYASFYDNASNFIDNVHPTHDASLELGDMLNAELEAFQAEGKLH